MHIQYINTLLAVTDMARAKHFYCDLLGMTITADFGANVTLDGHVALQTMDTWQSLLGTDAVTLRHRAGELYFECSDLDALIQRLEAHGITYVHPPCTQTWGQRVVRFYDPDGHILEAGEPIQAVVYRFRCQGMTPQEIAARMDVPAAFVEGVLSAPSTGLAVYLPDLRTPALIHALTAVWRASVEATHTFLTAREIDQIATFIPEAIAHIPVLVTVQDQVGVPIGFAGIRGTKLEMLFLHPTQIGRGLGRRLLDFAVQSYGVREVCVNEQNPKARAFYERAGFTVFRRSPIDEQGQPFPILYLRRS